MKVTLDVTMWAAAFSLSYGHRKSKCTLYIGYKHGLLHIGAVGCQMKCGFFKTMCLLCHSSAPTSAFVKEMRRYRREYIGCINTFRLGQNRNTNSYGQCVIFTNIFSIPLFTNLKLWQTSLTNSVLHIEPAWSSFSHFQDSISGRHHQTRGGTGILAYFMTLTLKLGNQQKPRVKGV